ncbi:uncharacterized protein SAPINGB_P002551 [Magnusiomyces paraingens]|uniref:Uncharacterized protein n=1 Tax=Magnusiomyces paraingens TaxID=2606893 RepID=A0A5E8BGL3_9ASCO|nr:uncharacterized protein SAPINGB_P002551 [Saprochaete ingens]VVT50001.1 unnamed protein product [Saprochaete ingens]
MTERVPGFFYADQYLTQQGVRFDHSIPATLTLFATIFGVAAIEIHAKDIYATGNLGLAKSGVFHGQLQFNDVRDLTAAAGRYQLVCQLVGEDLYVYLVQPPNMVPRGVLTVQVANNSEDCEFSGLIEFS